MSHYRHTLVLEAPPAVVYAALTTLYGLCCSAWHHFLDSLRQFVQTGRGMPYELAAAAVN